MWRAAGAFVLLVLIDGNAERVERRVPRQHRGVALDHLVQPDQQRFGAGATETESGRDWRFVPSSGGG